MGALGAFFQVSSGYHRQAADKPLQFLVLAPPSPQGSVAATRQQASRDLDSERRDLEASRRDMETRSRALMEKEQKTGKVCVCVCVHQCGGLGEEWT